MTTLDFVVLFAAILSIALYGMWRTRGHRNLDHYLKGDEDLGWATIGLSVMATQASAITFMSTPGQGFQDGLGFVQFYLGLPLALMIIAIVFLPKFRHLNVFTAYEYLGRRFDAKTRLFGAALFLLQRGLAAGITIYAPAIILSTMFGWRLDLTIILSGVLAIVYTTTGGSEAVSLTQRYQMAVIFGGMLLAFVLLLVKLPASFGDAMAIAGNFHHLKALDFSTDIHRRYTLWSGLLGGIFLQLSYFGGDQSQVQRYLTGASLRESRLGLMFNAVLKIPMQFSILLLGVLVFVFYQFEKPPVFFNEAEWRAEAARPSGQKLTELDQQFATLHAEKAQRIRAWVTARHAGDARAEAEAREQALQAQQRSDELRKQVTKAMSTAYPLTEGKDSDYVFITFILKHLPHGVIGLLVAAFFAAALSSKAAELNALASTTTVDFYRPFIKRNATDSHYVAASKWFTILWGLVALAFALYASMAENLIQAVNKVGSLFYGVALGLFLVAFFFKKVGGTAVFWAALAAELVVLVFDQTTTISFLWYNPIGSIACVLFSLILQSFIGPEPRQLQPALPVAQTVE